MIQFHQHALIKCCSKNIYLRPTYVLVRPTEKVSRKSATSEKNESRALVGHDGSIELIKRDAVKKELQSDENWMHFYVCNKIFPNIPKLSSL